MNVLSSFQALRMSVTCACTTAVDIRVSPGTSTLRNVDATTGAAAIEHAASTTPAVHSRLRLIMSSLRVGSVTLTCVDDWLLVGIRRAAPDRSDPADTSAHSMAATSSCVGDGTVGTGGRLRAGQGCATAWTEP